MDTALPTRSSVSQPIRWSLYAGLYTFVAGVLTAVIFSDMLVLLADVIGLPPSYWPVIFAGPTILVGPGAWGLIVERRESYTYRLGALFGLSTALFTGLLWTARFVSVWGIEMVVIPIITFLVVYVLGLAVIAGIVTGLPMMYARRRSRSRAS